MMMMMMIGCYVIRPVHEAVWAVVQRESQDAHVVRVEHPVAEAHALPLAHQASRAPHHLPVGSQCTVNRLAAVFKDGGGGDVTKDNTALARPLLPTLLASSAKTSVPKIISQK